MDAVALMLIRNETQVVLDDGVIDEVVVVYGDTRVNRVDDVTRRVTRWNSTRAAVAAPTWSRCSATSRPSTTTPPLIVEFHRLGIL